LKDSIHWAIELQGQLAGQPCVLVTLQQVLGSSPRESGCRMIVSAEAVHGSIGGGNLEFTAIAEARALLQAQAESLQKSMPFGLGPELSQCCGGAVALHFEKLPRGVPAWLAELAHAVRSDTPAVLATLTSNGYAARWLVTRTGQQPPGISEAIWQEINELLTGSSADVPVAASAVAPVITLETGAGEWSLEVIRDARPRLYLFGAGHVGQEVAQRVRGLPFRLTWLDQRPGIFPPHAAQFAELITTDPITAVAQAKQASRFVVMTHSHQLDEDICHAILGRADPGWDFAFLGLIGSATKRKRFVHRLKQRGISEAQLKRLECPIGLAGIRGKQPATIAFSLLAQLMLEPAQEQDTL
jgi:xanthine dehydrogenase accessory factor